MFLRLLLVAFFLLLARAVFRLFRGFLVRPSPPGNKSPRDPDPIRGGEIIDVDFTEHRANRGTKRPPDRDPKAN